MLNAFIAARDTYFSIYKSPATCMELNSFLCIEMTGRQKQTKIDLTERKCSGIVISLVI